MIFLGNQILVAGRFQGRPLPRSVSYKADRSCKSGNSEPSGSVLEKGWPGVQEASAAGVNFIDI